MYIHWFEVSKIFPYKVRKSMQNIRKLVWPDDRGGIPRSKKRECNNW